MGCGIGYGYLHRIPVRLLPDEKKPLIGVAQKPLPESVPYVPPLANTFTQNSTILAPESTPLVPTVPGKKLSDAEIIAGVTNISLSDNAQSPLIDLANEQPNVPPQVEGVQQPIQPIQPIQPVQHIQPLQPQQTAIPQHVFASIPPTSVASLNESFGIPTTEPTNQYYSPAVSNGQGLS